MDAERWQRLSPLLDAMFELDPETRVRSLELLREEDPQLAEDLNALMALERERADFLAEPLVAPLPGPRPGTIIGPYKLERMLGEGGMGQVWLAERADGLYQRRVALKLLRPGLVDPNLRLRFTRERQILARLEHPHIARLLDAGITSDGQPYLALDYVEGEPITDWCNSRALGLDTRLSLFLQICDAVSHAHANLIVHRDLKPSNILVTPLHEVRLLDFGIAKLLDTSELGHEHTRTGLRTFTLHYAAPEQIRGEPVTTMTDVYTLGVVLYELLTDSKPYRLKRQSDAEWEEAILATDPLRPSLTLLRAIDGNAIQASALRRRARALTGDLDNIVLKTLAKRSEQRYPSVEALALDLQRYRDGKPVLARPQSIGYRVRKYVHRHRWALATGALVTVVLSTALGIVTWQARQAVAEASRAQAMQEFVIGLFEQAGTTPGGAPLDVRQLLDAGVQRGNLQLARQPMARATLFGVIAQLRLGLGDYEQALTLLNRQATIIDALDEVSPGLRLESVTDLGHTQRLLGQEPTCVATMQPWQALARREEQQLPVQAAEFHSQLGRCRRALGEQNAARQLFQRSLALRRDPLDDEVGVIENLADLAALRADAGETRPALQAFSAALAQMRQTVGDRNPLAIDLQRQIAAQQRKLGNLPAAEAAYRDALRLSDELHGADHRDTLALRRQLAAAYVQQGRYVEADMQLAAAHAFLLMRPRGQSSLELGRSWSARGLVAWQRGDLAGADAALEQAAALHRQTPGQEQLATTLFARAGVLHAALRTQAALAALEEARRVRVAQAGSGDALLGDIERLTGEVLGASGRHAEASTHLQQAVRLTRAGYGPQHAQTRLAELAQARLWAVEGHGNAAQSRFAAIAALKGTNPEITALRWRARAYTGEAGCRGDARERAQVELDVLIAEMRATLTEGSSLSREISAIRVACS